jgi:hypothetical protein
MVTYVPNGMVYVCIVRTYVRTHNGMSQRTYVHVYVYTYERNMVGTGPESCDITLPWYSTMVQVYVPWYHGMLCHNFLIGKGTHVHREPCVFWEDTRQPVERGSE